MAQSPQPTERSPRHNSSQVPGTGLAPALLLLHTNPLHLLPVGTGGRVPSVSPRAQMATVCPESRPLRLLFGPGCHRFILVRERLLGTCWHQGTQCPSALGHSWGRSNFRGSGAGGSPGGASPASWGTSGEVGALLGDPQTSPCFSRAAILQVSGQVHCRVCVMDFTH